MDRKHEINEKAHQAYPFSDTLEYVFIEGACWADENPVNKWISVDDAYPEAGKVVLICTRNHLLHLAYWLETGECWQDPHENLEYRHVGWWHEIPKLPEM